MGALVLYSPPCRACRGPRSRKKSRAGQKGVCVGRSRDGELASRGLNYCGRDGLVSRSTRVAGTSGCARYHDLAFVLFFPSPCASRPRAGLQIRTETETWFSRGPGSRTHRLRPLPGFFFSKIILAGSTLTAAECSMTCAVEMLVKSARVGHGLGVRAREQITYC